MSDVTIKMDSEWFFPSKDEIILSMQQDGAYTVVLITKETSADFQTKHP